MENIKIILRENHSHEMYQLSAILNVTCKQSPLGYCKTEGQVLETACVIFSIIDLPLEINVNITSAQGADLQRRGR